MEYTKTEKQFTHELNSLLEEPLGERAVLVFIKLLRKYIERGEFVKEVVKVQYRTQPVPTNAISKTNKIPLKYILEMVSKETGIAIPRMKHAVRDTEVVLARKIYYYFSRMYTTHSLRVISLELMRQDHTTLVHAVQSLIDRIATDHSVQQIVNNLKIIFDDYENNN